MENSTPLDQQLGGHTLAKRDLPDAGGILTMGIVALPFSLGLVGIILSIIVLTKSKKALDMYNQNPEGYTEKSVSRVRAGRTCAIISLALFAAGTLMILALAE